MKTREPRNRLHTIGFFFGWLFTLAPIIALLPTAPGLVASFHSLGNEDPVTGAGTVGLGDMLPATAVGLILCPLGMVLLVVTFLARARSRRKSLGVVE